VAVVCKPATQLPVLPDGVERWQEADEPSHPALGIAHALESAAGPVLAVATDMPWVGVDECRRLLAVAAGAGSFAAAVVAVADGRIQPAFGLYRPAALGLLKAAVRDEGSLTSAVEALSPTVCDFPAAVLRGVNTPEELTAAELALSGAPAARSPRP
jgi:molybdopterin-guanine dinucleotide biosynthesis protein A